MKKELAELIVEIMQEFCPEEEIKLYENYSGRGMMKKNTYGVVVPRIGKLIAALITNADLLVTDEHGYVDPKFEIYNMNIDSLGLDTIIY